MILEGHVTYIGNISSWGTEGRFSHHNYSGRNILIVFAWLANKVKNA